MKAKNNIKSEVMRSAWLLFRNSNLYTWSQALAYAWSSAKNGVKIYTRTLFNKSVVLGFSKDGIHGTSTEEVLFKVLNQTPVSNEGAKHDYMTGKYQGD